MDPIGSWITVIVIVIITFMVRDSRLISEIVDLVILHIIGGKTTKILDIKDALHDADTTVAELIAYKAGLKGI